MIWTRGVPLTICPAANPIPQPLGNIQPFLELVDALTHLKETFIGFSHFGEGVQKRVGEVVHQAVLLWIGWMGNMLVHMHMLKERR